MNILKTIGAAAALATATLAAGAASAADYPSKKITVLIGYNAGGGTDTIGRVLFEEMKETLGQQITVVNMPGAASSVAALKLTMAKPDGYTLLLAPSSAVATNQVWNPNARYEVEDFTMIGSVAAYQPAFAAPMDRPYDTFADFVAWAKENPGAKVATITPASKVQMELVAQKEGLELNFVPVKGGAGMISGLLGGDFDIAYSGGAHQKYPDQIKTIAAAGRDRLAASPDIMTMDEYGYMSSYGSVLALVGPAGLPGDVVATLEEALIAAGRTDSVREVMGNLDFPPAEKRSAELTEDAKTAYTAELDLKKAVSATN
ncbi:MAG: tripartite tricarboxylate transporter substrate binding protein [Pseudooceanicola sp.]